MQLLFDFDGTLADCSPGIYSSFALACSKLNLHPPTYEDFRHSIGPPVQRLAKHFFPNLSEECLEAFRLLFRDDYDNSRFKDFEWYEDVAAVIEALAAFPGVSLAVVTNKPTKPTLELLNSGRLLDYFDLVVGVDYQIWDGSGPVFPSKSDAISMARIRLKFADSLAFYIGDTPADREASCICGLQFIAATYGFHRWQKSELSSTMKINTIMDLVPLLHMVRSANTISSP
jgi:phosphoglycolate phosphatase